MPSKSFLVLLGMALVPPLGCSEKAPDGGGAGMTGDDLFFVPEGLTNTEPNGEGGLTLIALTLLQGASSAELYAAVRNDGETPACNAGMTTNFLGKAGELVGSSGTTLQSGNLYQFTDGSGAIIPCVAPGEIGMAASTELPETIVIADLGSLEHQFPAFTVDGIVPIDGLSVGAVETVKRGAGSAYTGTFTNGLEVTVSAAKVMIFPVNRVGRPLGVATASATTDVPPGGSFSFETTAVGDVGVDRAAYAAASIP